jgi:hypothetical protein
MTPALNPSFNAVSQFSHVGWGFLLVIAAVLGFHAPPLWAASVVVVLAGAKEAYDCNGGETPVIAGDSWEDFFFWCLGVGLALVTLLRAGYFG